MPQITVYIRDKDLDKWKAIEKKSEFMHQALQNMEIMSSPGKSRLYAEILTREAQENSSSLRSELPLLARACCLNKVKPCKHWNWTGESYTNILTGEIREVNE